MPTVGLLEILLFVPLILIQVGLMVWALVDVTQRKHVKGNNKLLWILIIVIVSIIGPIVYFILGRQDEPNEENSAQN